MGAYHHHHVAKPGAMHQRLSSFWAVPVTGGEPRLLVRFDDRAMHSNRDDFASDGRNLYFTIGDMESDISVMELVGN